MRKLLLCLLVFSVIYGYRSKNKVLGQVQYPCTNCRQNGVHTLVRTRRWFTLYFIPVIPFSGSTTSRCNLCGYQERLSKEQVAALEAQRIPVVSG